MIAAFHILHLTFLFLLVGVTFAAFANPDPERRKKSLMYSGICSLGVLLSGFGLLGFLKVGFPLWIVVKLLCWLGLSGLAGIAFRKRDKIPKFTGIAIVLILVALTMVYLRPF